jgi:hypothetical protein
MWITARILTAFGTILYKLLFLRVPPKFYENFEDLSYVTEVPEDGKGNVRLITPLTTPFACHLKLEKPFERLCMQLGIGEEIQTGDRRFDDRIYVVGDHPSMADYLSNSKEVREMVNRLIPAKLVSISITGETLCFELNPRSTQQEVLPDLRSLAISLQAVARDVVPRFQDSGYSRALLAEALAFGALAYATVSFLNFLFDDADNHLWPNSLLMSGILLGLFVGLAVSGILKLLLGKSSWAPHVIREVGVVAAIGISVGSVQAVADYNRHFDRSTGIAVVRKVVKLETRGRKRKTYYLQIERDAEDSALPFTLPRRIKCSWLDWRELRTGGHVTLEVGMGALGFPWYRSITRY